MRYDYYLLLFLFMLVAEDIITGNRYLFMLLLFFIILLLFYYSYFMGHIIYLLVAGGHHHGGGGQLGATIQRRARAPGPRPNSYGTPHARTPPHASHLTMVTLVLATTVRAAVEAVRLDVHHQHKAPAYATRHTRHTTHTPTNHNYVARGLPCGQPR